LQATYDRVATEYTRRIADELQHKPLDRQLLEDLARRLSGRGVICDLGCGPGHVAAFLNGCGTEVVGVDLSPQMVAEARRRYPGLTFQQGNFLALEVPDDTWAGIAAFYSLIHVPRDEVTHVLEELRRVLKPGGLLLTAFHVGQEVVHLDEWWGHLASANFTFFLPDEMAGYMRTAGFVIEAVVERPPYPEVEHPSQRCYITARRPEGK
jgi:ubiquinone/menaquinone biosynthesis C-methylase UbiE